MVRTYKYQSIKNSIAKMSVESLIEEFNALVGKRYWTSARAVHDVSLIESLIRRGIDVSAILVNEHRGITVHVRGNLWIHSAQSDNEV